MSLRQSRDLTTRREANESYALRIHMPLLGAAADHSESSGGVPPGMLSRRVLRIFCSRQPVLQHKSSHTVLVRPVRDVPAFVLNHQLRMAAARRNDHGRPISLLFVGQKDKERRIVD